MFEDPLEVAYRTTVEVPRTGPVGKTARWFGDHPVVGGLACGIVVVIIAAISRPTGVASQPAIAAVLSAMVIITWMFLFFLMRGFFQAQSFAHVTVLRRLVVDDEHAVWLQQKEPIKELNNPRLRILTNPVPEGIGEEQQGSMKKAKAWPVWIVIDSKDETDDERLVFETRDAARRARDYDPVDDEITDHVDERLPRAIAAPILQRFDT